MSNRRNNPNTNRIRGPQSALTDFLASHNIDANQIRQEHEERLLQAARDLQSSQQQSAGLEAGQAATSPGNHSRDSIPIYDTEEEKENLTSAKKRKLKADKDEKEDKAIQKAKKAKAVTKKGKGKGKGKGKPIESSDEDNDFAPGESFGPAKPGQLENCGVCDKRFTVTGYSKEGAGGKLLCPKCSKEIEKDEKVNKAKKKKAVGHRRRQIQSNLLDGDIVQGPKSLIQLCIQKVAANTDRIDDFGDLPPYVLDGLAKIFSKKRVINSKTLDLFIHPETSTVSVYDAADLTTDDMLRIFAVDPAVKSLYLQNCGQFKDAVLDYVTNHPLIAMEHLRLGGANLVTDECWVRFFEAKGKYLKSFKINYVDGHFDDDTFSVLVANCPQLERLKLEFMVRITDESIEAMRDLKKLQHLTIQPRQHIESEPLVKLLSSSVGPQLRTLCLEEFFEADDDLLAAIHENCRHLSKLRISKNSNFTDQGLAALFTKWANPPLRYANFQGLRDVNAQDPTGNTEGLGLCSAGFEALMVHSGSHLAYLAVTSARHIEHAAFARVFDGVKQYPHLRYICVSFCAAVDDFILAGIFKSCPALKKIKIFACWNVADVVVPRGIVMLGKPNAQDDLAVEGEAGVFQQG